MDKKLCRLERRNAGVVIGYICLKTKRFCTSTDCVDCTGVPPMPVVERPGDKLHRALQRRFGVKESWDCGCDEHIATMNSWGYAKCLENIDTIVEWLYTAGQKRKLKIVKLPFARYAIKRFVIHTIKE